MSCICLGSVLGFVLGFSQLLLCLFGEEISMEGLVSLFAKVGNCLLKLLCCSGEKIGGSD